MKRWWIYRTTPKNGPLWIIIFLSFSAESIAGCSAGVSLQMHCRSFLISPIELNPGRCRSYARVPANYNRTIECSFTCWLARFGTEICCTCRNSHADPTNNTDPSLTGCRLGHEILKCDSPFVLLFLLQFTSSFIHPGAHVGIGKCNFLFVVFCFYALRFLNASKFIQRSATDRGYGWSSFNWKGRWEDRLKKKFAAIKWNQRKRDVKLANNLTKHVAQNILNVFSWAIKAK